jgi:hypothetical protein
MYENLKQILKMIASPRNSKVSVTTCHAAIITNEQHTPRAATRAHLNSDLSFL